MGAPRPTYCSRLTEDGLPPPPALHVPAAAAGSGAAAARGAALQPLGVPALALPAAARQPQAGGHAGSHHVQVGGMRVGCWCAWRLVFVWSCFSPFPVINQETISAKARGTGMGLREGGGMRLNVGMRL